MCIKKILKRDFKKILCEIRFLEERIDFFVRGDDSINGVIGKSTTVDISVHPQYYLFIAEQLKKESSLISKNEFKLLDDFCNKYFNNK